MKINVAQLLKGAVGDSRTYLVEEMVEESFPVKGEAKLLLTNRSILVTGVFETTVQSTCIRCLKEFEDHIEFTMEEEFFPTGDILTVASLPVEPEERADGFVIPEDHVLDLSEALRQNLWLNVPVNPICEPNCAGLCPRCGHDLNEGPCQCPSEPSDPRWLPLKEWLADQNGSKLKRGCSINHD